MDFNFRPVFQPNRKRYIRFIGRITAIAPMMSNNRRDNGCTQLMTVEAQDGSAANFVVSPSAYVVHGVTMFEGMNVVMFYDAEAPVPLIYPPQYNAVIMAEDVRGENIVAGFFDRNLTNAEFSLRLNIGINTQLITMNGQTFTGSPAGRNLIVLYGASTRSIPAQTTPDTIIVMCGM